jgi:ubiquinone/menaquinone biosynthesis methyltransferase
MPFPAGGFDGALCGFGLRNLPDPRAGLREMHRVLRPGAKLVVLDFFRPEAVLTRAVQALYNRRLLPMVGGAISGRRSAYQYLAASIERFASVAEARALMEQAGFVHVRSEPLTLGMAALLIGEAS